VNLIATQPDLAGLIEIKSQTSVNIFKIQFNNSPLGFAIKKE
jgi:hypothetical protein